MFLITGMIPIALTPFDDDGQVDFQSIETLADFYRQAGAQAIVVLGIMGEAHALSDREREAVIKAYVAACPGTPIVATISHAATAVAKDRARRAQDMGSSLLMAAPPPGIGDPALLIPHFSSIQEATTLPWILQDEPLTTSVRLSTALIQEIAAHVPRLTAVKVEDVPTPSKIDSLTKLLPSVRLFGGLGGLYLYEELIHGSQGSMTGFSYPNILARIIQDYFSANALAARQTFYRFLPLIRYEAQLGVKGIAIRKAVFYHRGLIQSPHVRAPAAAVDRVISQDLLELIQSLDLTLSPDKGSI